MNTLILSKFLSLLIYPLGVVILIGVTAFILLFTRWRRTSQLLIGLALTILWIAATPIFARWLDLRLEVQVPLAGMESLPQTDALIVLGGGVTVGRILDAWRIYHAGKAPVIVISGGYLPWEAASPEAERIANVLAEFGVPRSTLVQETASRTTRENAVNTAAIFKERGWRNGLLVTSGYHMPRALAAFRKVGIDVTSATTEVRRGSLGLISFLDLLPSAWALAWTTSTIKEIIGLWVYRYRGWA